MSAFAPTLLSSLVGFTIKKISADPTTNHLLIDLENDVLRTTFIVNRNTLYDHMGNHFDCTEKLPCISEDVPPREKRGRVHIGEALHENTNAVLQMSFGSNPLDWFDAAVSLRVDGHTIQTLPCKMKLHGDHWIMRDAVHFDPTPCGGTATFHFIVGGLELDMTDMVAGKLIKAGDAPDVGVSP